MPPIHREKSIDKYCQESLGYGSDTDSSSSGSCPTSANATATSATPGPRFEMSETRMMEIGLPSTSSHAGLPGISTFDFPFK